MAFKSGDNIIDSRDIIARIEELETEHDVMLEDPSGWKLTFWLHGKEGQEYILLKESAEEVKQYCPDWEYGEILIHESYFTEYAEELCKDCGAISKELPWYIADHIDWDGVAKELKVDYTEVELDGHIYFVR